MLEGESKRAGGFSDRVLHPSSSTTGTDRLQFLQKFSSFLASNCVFMQ